MNDELKYTLAISYTRGLGEIHTKKIIDFVGSAKKAWELKANELLQIKGLGKKTLENFGSEENLRLAEKEIEFLKKNKIKSAVYNSAEYPKRLKECIDCPPVLFWKGNINFESNKWIAIVGTRKETNYGRAFIKELISEIKSYNITIVSGLAFGCDITAHKASIENQIPTVAVLAHGLNNIFPKAHYKFGIEMQNNGGLISEFSSFHKAEPINFLKRNRIIAGLCSLTILVESNIKGGAMSTAAHANGYNREVMALPGRISDKYSSGCNHLIATHQAYALRNANDLLYHLNLNPKKSPKKQKELFIQLSPKEQKVYDFIEKKGKVQIDSICLELGVKTYEILPVLLDLEMKNLIIPLPGKYFKIL